VHEAVSDILMERAREADGLGQMVLVSLFAHASLIAVLVVLPPSWRSGSVAPEATPMMITISGGTGPDAGGMTPIATRPVQAEAPAATTTPPAPKAPEMVEPSPIAKPVAKTPPKPIEKPVDKASTRKPTSGPEVKPGDARVETGGAAIPFGGLTRPSGGGPASGAFTDYANFCCPEYLNQMTDLIKRNWNQNQGATGQVQVKFTIRRDGSLAGVPLVEKSSNQTFLDLESQRAITKVRQFSPLPREFTEPTLTVHLIFDYQR